MPIDLSRSRVLVTGGSGFLGPRVVERLRRGGSTEVLAPRSSEFDLRRPQDTTAMLTAYRPDVVIHLAAVVGGIGANMMWPGRFFFENASMGIHLIEETRLIGVKKFVCVGTVCAYPSDTPVPFREDDLWNGYPEPTNAPYGLAKKMLLVQLQAYRDEYGFNGIYLLPTNLYGPGDDIDPKTSHVIPALVRKFVEAVSRGDDEIVCWGTGSATRDFLFVDDCAEGIVAATCLYDGPDPVNLGSGSEVSIRELAQRIAELTGFDGHIVWDRTKPDGQSRRRLDVGRARQALGFEAKTSLEEGLRATVEWYQELRLASRQEGRAQVR